MIEQITVTEGHLSSVEAQISANDARYAEFPSAPDAQLFYKLPLRQLYSEKQDLLKVASELEDQLLQLYAQLDAELEASCSECQEGTAQKEEAAREAADIRRKERDIRWSEAQSQRQQREDYGI